MAYVLSEASPKLSFIGGLAVSILEKALLGGFPIVTAAAALSSGQSDGFFTRKVESYYYQGQYRSRFETDERSLAAFFLGAAIIYSPELYKIGEKLIELLR